MPTISQLHDLAAFFASSGYIDDATHQKLDATFDNLPVDAAGKVAVSEDEIEIEYEAPHMPWFGFNYLQRMYLFEGNEDNAAFKITTRDEFEFHHDFELLEEDIIANEDLAEFEAQLTRLLGTEVVTAMDLNGDLSLPEPRS